MSIFKHPMKPGRIIDDPMRGPRDSVSPWSGRRDPLAGSTGESPPKDIPHVPNTDRGGKGRK